jgi:hypothetical protein
MPLCLTLTILLMVFVVAGFGQTAPVISGITSTPNTGFASGSVALAPGSTASISGTNLADSTTSAATPGQSRLGGLEVHLVDASCYDATCELVASLLYTSPSRIDFIVPGIPDISRVWRTRVVVLKNAQRYDGLTAPDAVLIDDLSLESTPNPAVTGQPVTFKVHIAAMQGDPFSPFYFRTGAVTFMDGDTPLGMVSLSNVITYHDEPPLRRYDVSFTTSKLAPGNHNIRADYSGDHSNAHKSSGTLVQGVSVPEVSVSSTPNPSILGQTVTLIATVSPATCTGTVTFYDASTPSSTSLIALQATTPAYGPVVAESGALGTATLDRGRALFSTAALVVGAHPINVKYSGDGKCAPFRYAAGNDFQYRTISQTVVPQ